MHIEKTKYTTNKNFDFTYKTHWSLIEDDEPIFSLIFDYYSELNELVVCGSCKYYTHEIMIQRMWDMKKEYDNYFKHISLNSEEEFNDMVEIIFNYALESVGLQVKEKGSNEVCKLYF